MLHVHNVADAVLLKLCRRCVRPDLMQMRAVVIVSIGHHLLRLGAAPLLMTKQTDSMDCNALLQPSARPD